MLCCVYTQSFAIFSEYMYDSAMSRSTTLPAKIFLYGQCSRYDSGCGIYGHRLRYCNKTKSYLVISCSLSSLSLRISIVGPLSSLPTPLSYFYLPFHSSDFSLVDVASSLTQLPTSPYRSFVSSRTLTHIYTMPKPATLALSQRLRFLVSASARSLAQNFLPLLMTRSQPFESWLSFTFSIHHP